MSAIYLRTEPEAIEDGFLCAEPCQHVDCAQWRIDVGVRCRYCGELAAGHSCFIESGQYVHAACVMERVER